MTFDVNGFGTPPVVTMPAPQTEPGAAPAAPAQTAQPQDGPLMPPGASVQPQTTAQPAPAAQPLEFNGRRFESQQALEGYVRQVIKSAEGRIRVEVQGQMGTAPQPAVPQANAPASPPAEPEPDRAYDVETLELIRGKFGDAAAEDYRARAIAEHHRVTTKKLMDENLAPYRERDEEDAFKAEVTEMWSRAESAAGSNGQPLIPELKSQAAAQAIVKIWQEFPIEYARTPMSVLRAAQIYRGTMLTIMAPTPPPPTPPPSGQTLDASVTMAPGFVQGTQAPSHIPRPTTVNPFTGERVPVR